MKKNTFFTCYTLCISI